MKVQQTIVAKCPNLAVPYRRLVCYCRLYEVQDRNKKDRPGGTLFLHAFIYVIQIIRAWCFSKHTEVNSEKANIVQ